LIRIALDGIKLIATIKELSKLNQLITKDTIHGLSDLISYKKSILKTRYSIIGETNKLAEHQRMIG